MRWVRVLAVLAVVPVLFAGPAPVAQPSLSLTAEGAASKVVGEVTSVSGSKSLFLKAGDGKEKLRKGDKLHLGDVVLMGKGVKATLEVSRPASVDADKELVQVKPIGTTKHLMLLHREGKTTVVKIQS